jgi:hypothetical protein
VVTPKGLSRVTRDPNVSKLPGTPISLLPVNSIVSKLPCIQSLVAAQGFLVVVTPKGLSVVTRDPNVSLLWTQLLVVTRSLLLVGEKIVT